MHIKDPINKTCWKKVKICQTGLLKLNFEIIPKKCIFRFLPKISAGHGCSLYFFYCQFPNPWTLRVSGMCCYTSKCEKSQNHCTLIYIQYLYPRKMLPTRKAKQMRKENLLCWFDAFDKCFKGAQVWDFSSLRF